MLGAFESSQTPAGAVAAAKTAAAAAKSCRGWCIESFDIISRLALPTVEVLMALTALFASVKL